MSRMSRLSHFLFGVLFLFAMLPARAELMLHPTRIVFEKNQRAAQIELINNGTQPATYRISVVNRRMTEAGKFEAAEIPAPDEHFADTMLRFSPRQVTLQPGAVQTVRVMLRKPADLPEGEYRSHLQFDKLPDPDGATSIDRQGATGIGVVLNALIGASVPVIVRHGATTAQVSMADLSLGIGAAGEPLLRLRFERTGNASVYGDLNVTFTPQGGQPRTLAQIGGIAVYTPNRTRLAALSLEVPPGSRLAHGTLSVSFRERAEAGGALLAQAHLDVP